MDDLQPGAFVRLESRGDSAYQLVSLDDQADSCWVRRWPLSRNGSPPFSVPLSAVRGPVPQP